MTQNSFLRQSRRSFLKQLGLAGASAPFLARGWLHASPNEILHHASFGTQGMAAADIAEITRHPKVRLVAVADVDLGRAAIIKKQFPKIRVYQDWRQLLDKEKEVNTANVTVPDHMHGPIAMSAMLTGKDIYCQKPLTHDLYETRQLTRYAHDHKRVTQMGIQIHSALEYRTAVHLIRNFAIGKVKEVHSWSDKKWGDLSPRPDRSDPIPANFNWDDWIGIASPRPFLGHAYYHPANWRKRLDFGTGTFGDMGCHIYDPVYNSLKLTAPISVRSEGPVPNKWNWTINDVIHYVFPGTAYTADSTVKVTWYDGDARPPKAIQALIGDQNMPGQGSIFVGTQGTMLLPHVAPPQLLPESKFADYHVQRVLGENHWHQWVEAVLGNETASANFDYAGPLTETVLLGSVATHFPHTTLEWDAARLEFTNESRANHYVRRTYRDGWHVKNLS